MGSVIGGAARGFGDLVGNIPVVGGAMKKVQYGIGDAIHRETRPFFAETGPRPEYSQYKSLRGPDELLRESLQVRPGALGPGYQAFQERALAAPGTSAWEQMALNRQALEQQKAAQGAIESGQARAAEARGTLARRGGLSSGARERLAKGSMRDVLMSQQGVAGAGQLARADIGLQGEQQRLSALERLPGMEAGRREEETGAQRFNIQQALEQKRLEEAAKLAEYQEKMRAYAAAQQANAIAAAGPRSAGILGEGGPLGGIFG